LLTLSASHLRTSSWTSWACRQSGCMGVEAVAIREGSKQLKA
jgi:hypothetical protein